MEPTQQTNTPIEAGTGTTPLPREKSSLGVLVTLIIVIALIVVGAFYLFKERRSEIKNGTEDTAAKVEELGTQSGSTDIAAIEADLSAETPEEFDAEIDKAFADIDAALETE